MEGKLSFILLSTLLCATAVELAAATSPSNPFILASCQTTQYPALCVQTLAAYGPTVGRSARQLARLALTVSAERARAVSTFVSNIPTQHDPLGPKDGGALKDCVETLKDSVDELRKSVKEMRRMGRKGTAQYAWHVSNVQTWVSAVITDQSTCVDGLSEEKSAGGFSAAIQSKIAEVSQVTSNALALVNRLKN